MIIAPKMANLAEQVKDMAGVALKIQTRRHNHTPAVVSPYDKNIEIFTNSFADESSDLFNLVTKVIILTSRRLENCIMSRRYPRTKRLHVTLFFKMCSYGHIGEAPTKIAGPERK